MNCLAIGCFLAADHLRMDQDLVGAFIKRLDLGLGPVLVDLVGPVTLAHQRVEGFLGGLGGRLVVPAAFAIAGPIHDN